MKRLIIIPIIALAAACLLQACRKDKYTSRVVETGAPTITLQGAPAITLNRGASWTDPGATWTDSVTGEKGTITFTVNTSADTALLLIYTATDKNGFQSSVTRGVGITDMNDTIDISGAYNDNAGGVDTLVKVSRALFYNPNVNLSGNYGYIVIKSDSTISVSNILAYTGATLPETFYQAQISYAPPVTFQYVDSISTIPAYVSAFQHQGFGPIVNRGGVVIH